MRTILTVLAAAALLAAGSTAFAGDRPHGKKPQRVPPKGRVEHGKELQRPKQPQLAPPVERMPGSDLRERIFRGIMERVRSRQGMRHGMGQNRFGMGPHRDRMGPGRLEGARGPMMPHRGPGMSSPGKGHCPQMRGGPDGRPGFLRGLGRFRQERERIEQVKGRSPRSGPDRIPGKPGAPAMEMLKKAVRAGNAEAVRNITSNFRAANPEAFRNFITDLRQKNPEAFKELNRLMQSGKKKDQDKRPVKKGKDKKPKGGKRDK